jgi:hypothetical protein
LVVALDAERGGHPRVGMTLTTVDPHHDLARFRRDVEKVVRAIRARYPECEYLGFMEWTTGRGARSGGHRRVHQHLLVKGVPVAACEAVESVVRRVWRERTGATQVEVRELRSVAGATAYLVHHHNKRDQAPPEGFRGKRLRPSRGYYVQPVAQLREQARALLQDRRLRQAASRLVDWEYLDGAPDELAEAELRAALNQARAETRAVFVSLGALGRPSIGSPAALGRGHDDLAPPVVHVPRGGNAVQWDLNGEIIVNGEPTTRLRPPPPASAIGGA